MKYPRKLKIHAKHRSRRWDYTTVPEIRLEGKWLSELGFEQGKQVSILEQQNKLIITVNKNTEE